MRTVRIASPLRELYLYEVLDFDAFIDFIWTDELYSDPNISTEARQVALSNVPMYENIRIQLPDVYVNHVFMRMKAVPKDGVVVMSRVVLDAVKKRFGKTLRMHLSQRDFHRNNVNEIREIRRYIISMIDRMRARGIGPDRAQIFEGFEDKWTVNVYYCRTPDELAANPESSNS